MEGNEILEIQNVICKWTSDAELGTERGLSVSWFNNPILFTHLSSNITSYPDHDISPMFDRHRPQNVIGHDFYKRLVEATINLPGQ
jgi:hypothetical protein